MRSSHVWRVLSAVPKLIPWSHYQTARRTATNVRHHHGYLILAVFILLLIPSPLFAQQPEYQVIQIPVPVNEAYGCLNDSGVAAGITNAYRPWMWEKGDSVTYLPNLGGDVNEVLDI